MTLARLIKSLVVLVVIANVLFWLPTARLFCLYAMGRASRCPLSQSVHSFDTLAHRVTIRKKIDREKRLIESDAAGFHLWDTSRGRFWIPSRDDVSLADNLAEQATKVYGEGENGVQLDDVVLDCGANVGVFTREALANGAQLVVAVEPGPENVECLRRNFAPEIAKGTVIVVPKGVWNRDDVLTFHVAADTSTRSSFVGSFGPGARAEIKVPLTTIDGLVSALKLEKVDFIKLDVEGAEKNALIGAKDTLVKHHPRLAIAMEHLADDPLRIPEIVFAESAAYRVTCGDCIDEIGHIRPDVLFFHVNPLLSR